MVEPLPTPDGAAVARLSDERLRRFAWRIRRGLLENDLVLSRFLASRDGHLSEAEAAALDRLLNLTDPDLLDLILARKEPVGELAEPDVVHMLGLLRAC